VRIVEIPAIPAMPSSLAADLKEAPEVSAPQTLQERLLKYVGVVEGALMGLILDEKTPSDTKLSAIAVYMDRVAGAVPRVTVSHNTDNSRMTPGTAPQFIFNRSVPPPGVMDVPSRAVATVPSPAQ
jgi:hypothetical protein